MPKLKPEDVAEAVLYAITTPENVQVSILRTVFPNINYLYCLIFLDTRTNNQTYGRVLVS